MLFELPLQNALQARSAGLGGNFALNPIANWELEMARKTNERMVAELTNASTLLFKVVDSEGQTLEMYSAVQVSLDDIPGTLHTKLALHGLKQKVADAAAIPRDEKGHSATWGQKLSAMQTVVENLIAGEWSSRGEGGGSPTGLLFTAFCRLYPTADVDGIREKIAGMDRATQAKMRKVPKVAAMIETIKAERATAGDEDDDIDVDGMMQDLM